MNSRMRHAIAPPYMVAVDNWYAAPKSGVIIIRMKEFVLMIHPTFGMIGAFAALWVFIEILNVSQRTIRRIRVASLVVTLSMIITWITGGFWYVTYYAADKAIILKGPWPLAHNLVMETKEHLFFITLILALLLPIAVYSNALVENKSARVLVGTVALLIVLSAFALEGAGAIISMGVKVGLMHALLK